MVKENRNFNPLVPGKFNPLVSGKFVFEFLDESSHRCVLWGYKPKSKISGQYLHPLPRYMESGSSVCNTPWSLALQCALCNTQYMESSLKVCNTRHGVQLRSVQHTPWSLSPQCATHTMESDSIVCV